MTTLAATKPTLPTLLSNTGLDSHRQSGYGLGIDWLTVMFKFPLGFDFISAMDYLASGLLDTVVWAEDSRPIKRGKWFECSARTVAGIQICWNTLESGIECLVSIPSRGLTVGQLEVARTFSYLRQYVNTVSRMDIFIDDYSMELGALRELMVEARNNGNQVGFQRVEWRVSSPSKDIEERTLYLGSRESAHFYRIYDKGNRVRMEVELKDYKATQAFDMWLDCFACGGHVTFEDGTMDALMTSLVLSHIDFVDKKDKNLDRNERLSWWQDFIDKVNGSRVKFNRELPKATIERTKEWVERQVETSLAMLKVAMGSFEYTEWMGRLMDEGNARISAIHRSLIQNYRQVTEYVRRQNLYAV